MPNSRPSIMFGMLKPRGYVMADVSQLAVFATVRYAGRIMVSSTPKTIAVMAGNTTMLGSFLMRSGLGRDCHLREARRTTASVLATEASAGRGVSRGSRGTGTRSCRSSATPSGAGCTAVTLRWLAPAATVALANTSKLHGKR